jgi:hypothetical protein
MLVAFHLEKLSQFYLEKYIKNHFKEEEKNQVKLYVLHDFLN